MATRKKAKGKAKAKRKKTPVTKAATRRKTTTVRKTKTFRKKAAKKAPLRRSITQESQADREGCGQAERQPARRHSPKQPDRRRACPRNPLRQGSVSAS